MDIKVLKPGTPGNAFKRREMVKINGMYAGSIEKQGILTRWGRSERTFEWVARHGANKQVHPTRKKAIEWLVSEF